MSRTTTTLLLLGTSLLSNFAVAHIAVELDYQHTVDDGLFLDEVESFDALA